MDQLDLVNPDLIIFSIGINDAYEPSFLPETYFKNYDTLINLIKDQFPGANFYLRLITIVIIRRK